MPQGDRGIFEFLLLLRRATERERRPQRRTASAEAPDALFHRLQTRRRLRRDRRIFGCGFHHRAADLGGADSFSISADSSRAWVLRRLAGDPASASANTSGSVGATRRTGRAIRARTRLRTDGVKVEVFGNCSRLFQPSSVVRGTHRAPAINRALLLWLCAKTIRAARHKSPGQWKSIPHPAPPA